MNRSMLFSAGIAALAMSAAISAAPFTAAVSGDGYSGVVNGIPTPNDNNDGIPDINDAVNLLLGTSYARNSDVDPLFLPVDDIWTQTQSPAPVALIGLTAGNQNTLGIYTDLGVGATKTPVIGPYNGFGFLGDGSMANPFPAQNVLLGVGNNFGWYLESDNGSKSYWYSESSLNAGGWDHMVTYHLAALAGQTIYVDYGAGPQQLTFNDPYLIAWEDLPFANGVLGDDDYDDMIYLFDKVAPTQVPEPATLLLLGFGVLGMLGIGASRRHSRTL